MAPPQWAYQVENFVNEPDEELVCSVCRSVFCDPVMCPCDHVFCRACITKWLESNRNCPICRKRVSHSSVKQMVPIVKNIISKLMLNCHSKNLGCTAHFSLEGSEAHVKECDYELVQCKNKPCKDKLFRKDVAAHQENECPHRYVKCKTCGLKMPTSTPPRKHNCIRALQLRLRKKQSIIQKKNQRIKELKNENKTLKVASQGSEQSGSSQSFADLRDRIMINVAEWDQSSSSFSSDSEDSSESLIFFASSPLSNSENGESDSFLTFMDNQDSIEFSRNENSDYEDFGVYRHAEAQTVEDYPINEEQNNRNGNSASVAHASVSTFDENGESSESRRPVKRRPTTDKPAKRRHPVISSSDSEVDESARPQPSSKQCWVVTEIEGASGGSSGGNTHDLHMDVGSASALACNASGPSSSAPSHSASGPDRSSNTKWHFRSGNQKQTKEAFKKAAPTANKNPNATTTSTVAPRNAVFERTLALLEQYNLESDPEWLPEHASHRGDTPSESDSSNEAECIDVELSSSELSESDHEDDPNVNAENYSNMLKWILTHTTDDESSDDPDWNPVTYLQNKYG